MTKEEGIKKLAAYCKDEVKKRSWFSSRTTLRFEKTRYLEPYEKEANLPLPGEILLKQILIISKGIKP